MAEEWKPISASELDTLIERELAECSESLREFYARTRIEPAKWSLSPWGARGGGFWAVARVEDRVLWFNDIEDGFNVSRFDCVGEIPDDEYWCNQDPLKFALPTLRGEPGGRSWPPRPARGT